MAPNSLLTRSFCTVFRDQAHGDVLQKSTKLQKSEKFTKRVAVAPNSLLTGANEPVFRNKAHGDVRKANKNAAQKIVPEI